VRALLVAGVATALFSLAAGTAHADVAAFASDGSDPWTGGAAVTSQLETVAGTIASTVAGRPVSVRCESDSDWTTVAGGVGFEPSQVLGFVTFTDSRPGDYAELAPDVCRSLQAFAVAATKPTKCQVVVRTPQTTIRTVRKKKLRRTTYVSVVQPAAPCFANGRALTGGEPFWNDYFYTAEALQTLVHESIHLEGDPVEANAECYGMQYLDDAAQQLGDTPDDAAAIAQYYATKLYPQRQTQAPAYWSSGCHANGALDLTPNDGVWP
jgi:hypothetical protein